MWPQLTTTRPWLIAGPVLHDAVIAPLVGLTGLALGRLLPGRSWWWIRAGVTATATLLLIAAPLVLRPAPAPPNPGLQDRDYLTGLEIWLAVLWGAILAAATFQHRRAAARSPEHHRPDDHQSGHPPVTRCPGRRVVVDSDTLTRASRR
jgi:hypothetical protein